jgi:hypothetical protein
MLDLARIESLGEALRDAMITYKSNVALLEADRHRETARLSYRDLRLAAERVAARLQSDGLRAGDRVGKSTSDTGSSTRRAAKRFDDHTISGTWAEYSRNDILYQSPRSPKKSP